jgi:hypothetical protein
VFHHLPGKKIIDIFLENPANFVIHQISEQKGLYINLFEAADDNLITLNKTAQKPAVQIQAKNPAEISSRAQLEQILVKMIEAATKQSPGSYIPINAVGIQFQRQYRQSVTTVLKKLQLKVNFIKFLQSCTAFELKQTDKGWGVAVGILPSEDA